MHFIRRASQIPKLIKPEWFNSRLKWPPTMGGMEQRLGASGYDSVAPKLIGFNSMKRTSFDESLQTQPKSLRPAHPPYSR